MVSRRLLDNPAAAFSLGPSVRGQKQHGHGDSRSEQDKQISLPRIAFQRGRSAWLLSLFIQSVGVRFVSGPRCPVENSSGRGLVETWPLYYIGSSEGLRAIKRNKGSPLDMDGEITVQLGSVRRYARFLCLDADEADELLVDALQHLKPRSQRSPVSTRIEVFKALHKRWIPVDRPGFVPTNKLDYLLAKLGPMDRAALLLCVFEGFSTLEAAAITGLSESELEAAIGRAHTLTGFGWSRKVLIFSPDSVVARQLEDMVAELGFEVEGPLSSPREVIAFASRSRPDLIISDAELDSEESGIEAVKDIRRALDVPVILLTSRPGQHTELCSAAGTFLVRKPLSPVSLSGCLRQALVSAAR